MKIGKGFWVLIGVQIALILILIFLVVKQNRQENYISVLGPQGAQGPQGKRGPQGNRGYTPVKGVDYFDGVSIVGPKGNTGKQGNTGKTGATGPQGVQGLQGPAGPLLETRCVQLIDGRIRHDKRYSGDSQWQVDFYLPIGSSCG